MGYCRQTEVRRNSSSGGAFWILASRVLKKNGVVYGAAFLDDFSIGHIRVDSMDDLYRCMNSKYVQSTVSRQIYLDLKEDLEAEKKVIFTGTPCQINAMYSFLGELSKSENLLLVEVVCHGVASPAVWKSYVDYMQRKYKSKIKNVNFRDKSKGWHDFCLTMDFENSRFYRCSHHLNTYMKLYLDNLILRKSCYMCSCKGDKSRADLSIADAWTIESEKKNMSDDKGVSLVIVHTKRGMDWWNRSSDKELFENSKIDWNSINKALHSSAEYNPNRTILLDRFKSMDTEEFWNSVHISLRKRVLYLLRCICDQFGISGTLRIRRKGKR